MEKLSNIKPLAIYLSIFLFACFYGINWISHRFLPKWVDIFIGLPVSIFFMFWVAPHFIKFFSK